MAIIELCAEPETPLQQLFWHCRKVLSKEDAFLFYIDSSSNMRRDIIIIPQKNISFSFYHLWKKEHQQIHTMHSCVIIRCHNFYLSFHTRSTDHSKIIFFWIVRDSLAFIKITIKADIPISTVNTNCNIGVFELGHIHIY